MKRSLNLASGLIACIVLASMASSAWGDDGTLYVASKVYTMDGDPISPGQVLVVDGKIKSVGKSIDLGGLSPTVVELGEGSVLMPGLVDAYSQTGLGDGGTDEVTNEVTLGFRAIHSVDWSKRELRRQFENGTTTMCVCPGTQNVISGTAAIIKTAEIGDAVLSENGALLASMCNDPIARNRSRARPDSIFVRQPTNRMGVVWILRSTLDKARRTSDSASMLPLTEVLDGKRPIMMVSRMSHDLNTVATLADEFGFSPIIVGGQEAYKVKQMIAERKYPVILEPIGTGVTRGPEGSELCWNQPGVLADAGIVFALSGDDLLEQARFASRNGLDKNRALEAITSTPAKLLSIDKRVGSIAAGKDADLIALTGEPLELTTAIRWVMVNGKITFDCFPVHGDDFSTTNRERFLCERDPCNDQ